MLLFLCGGSLLCAAWKIIIYFLKPAVVDNKVWHCNFPISLLSTAMAEVNMFIIY